MSEEEKRKQTERDTILRPPWLSLWYVNTWRDRQHWKDYRMLINHWWFYFYPLVSDFRFQPVKRLRAIWGMIPSRHAHLPHAPLLWNIKAWFLCRCLVLPALGQLYPAGCSPPLLISLLLITLELWNIEYAIKTSRFPYLITSCLASESVFFF